MVKYDEPVVEQIDRILDELVGKGEILASCPHCKQHISYSEKQLLYCKTCSNKINNKDILYIYNKAFGQNN